ncbi:Ribosomal protein S6 modification protein [Paraliobacillus sp. PM-2]|uniref:ATP-grasp domain-containing protein n=1 Tax=Paraliobacillus sp. PM-2 TaxID=1462524 RepID=UPI00061B9391|nr:RimK family alpha-L-glutamate ligase [Paraliobacillus sp. PM-2]CQR48023.1 Ribosomal protein S6 modification protein [Paraliobacillus sp. PM-2]
MHGWVIYNGHLQSEAFLTFSQWIHNAGKKFDMTIEQRKNNELFVLLDKGKSLLDTLNYQNKPDFVIFIDKDIALAKQLEAIGIPVFNSVQAIATCDNKVDMYPVLHQANIAIPKTVIAPKIFSKANPIQLAHFHQLEKIFQYPFIIKEGYGSYGQQVYLIPNREELEVKISEIADRPFLFQEFIDSSYGRDLRIYVVGNEIVAGLARTAHDDFRANVSVGGTVKAHLPTIKEQKIAIEAAKAVGADFAGVDLLYDEKEEPIVCEVNTSAHIKNIYDYTGVNIAEHIITWIVKKLTS